MFKWIARDYFAAFRWRNVKEVIKGETLFSIVFWLWLSARGFIGHRESLLIYILVHVPMAFTTLSGKLHTMKLPKAMFLCPIERNVRREYVIKSCYFRIGVTTAVNALAVFTLVCMGLCDWISSIVLIINGLFFALLKSGVKQKGSMYSEPYPSTEITKENIVEILNIIFIILSSYGVACMLGWDTPVQWKVKCIYLGIVIVVQLPLTAVSMIGWKKSVEQATDYESSYL